MYVLTASQNLRRPEVSERCPVTGASTAISSPAAASAQPSCASTVPSGPKLELVK